MQKQKQKQMKEMKVNWFFGFFDEKKADDATFLNLSLRNRQTAEAAVLASSKTPGYLTPSSAHFRLNTLPDQK